MRNAKNAFIYAIAGLVLGMGLAPISHGEEKVSTFQTYSGYSDKLYNEWVRTTVHVPVRDGTRLAVTIWRPAVNGKVVDSPYPVVFNFTPYVVLRLVNGKKVAPAIEGPNTVDTTPLVNLTRYGYVVAAADVRGKGASMGVRWAYQDRTEANDGHDLVEWLGTQPWSSGSVGMEGCSYHGSTQWAAARTLPPHLKAIIPAATLFDAYDLARQGGILGQYNTRYQDENAEARNVAPVDGDTDGSLLQRAIQQRQANGQMLYLNEKLPFRDSRDPKTDIQYWNEMIHTREQFEAIDRAGIAVYAWGSYLDEANQAALAFANLHQHSKLLMSPGVHCRYDNFDSFTERLRFYDHYLKGIDNGIDREPPVTYANVDAHELDKAQSWNADTQFPPADVPLHAWYLSGRRSGSVKSALDGTLGEAPREASTGRYTVSYDVGCIVKPRDRVTNTDPLYKGKPEPGLWPCSLDNVAATYTSEPLQHPLHILGFPIVNLRLRSSTPDANIFAYLELVDEKGEVTDILSHGRLKVSRRKLGPAPYEALELPWITNLEADAQPLRASETALLRFALGQTSTIVPRGWRLRFVISGADLRQRDLENIKENPPPLLTLLYGKGEVGSWVELPTARK